MRLNDAIKTMAHGSSPVFLRVIGKNLTEIRDGVFCSSWVERTREEVRAEIET